MHLSPPDLTTCDREPITRLDCIQNFGFLLAVANDKTIVRASANLSQHAGTDAAAAIGMDLSQLIGPAAQAAIRARMAALYSTGNERIFGVELMPGGPPYDFNLHIVDDLLIVEGEPSRYGETADAASMVRSMLRRLADSPTLEAFHKIAARQVRDITGFDRVMVYRFDAAGNGEVIAEAAVAGIERFLGLHYPATDIPQQARELYIRNSFRIIADVGAAPVPLLPEAKGAVTALDLTQAITRAVSPVHIEYLSNMGVRATLSISIIVEGELWGLFACHHYAPLLPGFAMRTVAELFGSMYSLALESRLRRAASVSERLAHKLTDQMISAIAGNSDLISDPHWLEDMLQELIDYDGIAIISTGTVHTQGSVPTDDKIRLLARHLNVTSPSKVFTTDHLAQIVPAMAATAANAAGLLAIPISRSPRDYIMLFRREWRQTIIWGGDPAKLVGSAEDGHRMSPRKSFAAFAEIIRNKARPFSDGDQRAAEVIRSTMIEVILRLTEVANNKLAVEVEARRLVARELVGLNTDFEAEVARRTDELMAANRDLALEIADGSAALERSQASIETVRVDLLSSEGALASSRALHKLSLSDLLHSKTALASSRAETRAKDHDLLESAEASQALAHANEVLAVNEQVLEDLVRARTTALSAEINTRRIIATAIAHELNQPLMAISSYLAGVARLAERGVNDPKALDLIADAMRQAAGQAVRAGDMLKLLRGSITRDDTALTVENIGDLVAEATDAARAATSSGVAITLQADPAAFALINRTQIKQVLANLIQNATEAASSGQTIALTVGTQSEDNTVIISVADRGPGVAAEQLDTLFVPFVSSKPNGMGIGLSISREIVEQHHGKLTMRPNPDGGAIFTFTLPQAAATLAKGAVTVP